MAETPHLVLDIHIPFVSEKLKFSTEQQLIVDHNTRMQYLAALEAEAKTVAADTQGEVQAIRLSGPAPSIMSPDGLAHLIKQVREFFTVNPRCEISIAALPETIGTPSLTGWGAGGINRVRLIADTLQPKELNALHRPFDEVQIQDALLFLDKFNQQNVDVTLSVGIPGQTEVTLMQNLRSLNTIDTAHLTLRPILVAGEGVLDPDQQQTLFEKAVERLKSYGYYQYMPGSFVKKNHWCSKSAQALSEGAQLVGLGLGATSYNDNIAYTNTQNLQAYLQDPTNAEAIIAEAHSINNEAAQTGYVFNRLTYADGFTREAFEQRFETINPAVENQIVVLVDEGLIACEDGRYHLTPNGQFRWLFA